VVLNGVSLTATPGSTLAVLGRNGAGKTTLFATLMGLTTFHGGMIRMGGRAIDALPTHRRARLGLGYVSQEREIFSWLTVMENLAVSALPGGWPPDRVFGLFPLLAERRRTTGNRLSGGEQQMLAIARALLGGPKILLLDEPLEGLAPIVVENLFAALLAIRNNAGVTIDPRRAEGRSCVGFCRGCSRARTHRVPRQDSRVAGRMKRCNTGCWRSANCEGRGSPKGPKTDLAAFGANGSCDRTIRRIGETEPMSHRVPP
jgi:branched-chain amino acid transport system ATP-binding protein